MWTKPGTVPGTVIEQLHVVALPEVEMDLVGDCLFCVRGNVHMSLGPGPGAMAQVNVWA